MRFAVYKREGVRQKLMRLEEDGTWSDMTVTHSSDRPALFDSKREARRAARRHGGSATRSPWPSLEAYGYDAHRPQGEEQRKVYDQEMRRNEAMAGVRISQLERVV